MTSYEFDSFHFIELLIEQKTLKNQVTDLVTQAIDDVARIFFQTKPARPPPRPALPPNAWSGGEPLRSTGQAAPSISVEERRKQFNKM